MKNTLLIGTFLAAGSALQAQALFYDAQFDVETTEGVYARNITVLPVGSGEQPAARDLNFRAYIPTGDSLAVHPTVVINHTGSFLPPIINGGYTGSINDSVVVNTAKRLAERGYVAIAMEYRAGWTPIAEEQAVRTGTLLGAAYRGQVDLKTMMRFLRKQAAEDGNPLQVDTTRLAAWGYGTGGYNVVNANFLDRYDEVLIEKFIGPDDAPFVIPARDGDVDGLEEAALNIPNHVGYSSDFDFAVNAGGALGDSTWLEGKDEEAPVVGVQAQFDPFAPFFSGGVIVPTTGQFVVDVAGGLLVVDRANRLGVNDELLAVSDSLVMANDPITLYARGFGDVEFETREGATAPLSVPNFLPRVGTASLGLDFVDEPTLEAVVAATNQVTGDTVTAARLISNDLRTNPNTQDPTAAKAALDTVFSFVLPRMYAALDLGEVMFTSVVDLPAAEVGLQLAPNPASDFVLLSVASDVELSEVTVVSVSGQVLARRKATGSGLSLRLDELAGGMHYLIIRTDKGTVAERLVIR